MQDLRRLVRGDHIEARPQSTWERLARRLARIRRRLAVVAVVLLLLAVSSWLAVELLSARRERQWEEYRTDVIESARLLFRGEMVLVGDFASAAGLQKKTTEVLCDRSRDCIVPITTKKCFLVPIKTFDGRIS